VFINPPSGSAMFRSRLIEMNFVLIGRPLPRLLSTAESHFGFDCLHFSKGRRLVINHRRPYGERHSLRKPLPLVAVIAALSICPETITQTRRHWLLSNPNMEKHARVRKRVQLGPATHSKKDWRTCRRPLPCGGGDGPPQQVQFRNLAVRLATYRRHFRLAGVP